MSDIELKKPIPAPHKKHKVAITIVASAWIVATYRQTRLANWRDLFPEVRSGK
jgi:hypothetical protein